MVHFGLIKNRFEFDRFGVKQFSNYDLASCPRKLYKYKKKTHHAVWTRKLQVYRESTEIPKAWHSLHISMICEMLLIRLDIDAFVARTRVNAEPCVAANGEISKVWPWNLRSETTIFLKINSQDSPVNLHKSRTA